MNISYYFKIIRSFHTRAEWLIAFLKASLATILLNFFYGHDLHCLHSDFVSENT